MSSDLYNCSVLKHLKINELNMIHSCYMHWPQKIKLHTNFLLTKNRRGREECQGLIPEKFKLKIRVRQFFSGEEKPWYKPTKPVLEK